MKIFFVVGGLSGSGGVDRVVANLSDCFAKKGDDVSIYLINSGFDFPTTAKIIHYKANYKVRLFRIIEEIVGACKIKKRITIEKPDIIYNTCWILPIICFFQRGKIFSAIHNDPSPHMHHMNWKLRFLIRFLKWSNKVIVPVNTLKTTLEDDFGFKNVIVISNPLDFELIDSKKNEAPKDLTDFSSYILAVGRLDKVKGFDLLINAYSLTRAKEKVHLVIIGEGEERNNLQKLIDEKNLSSRIHLIGARDNPFAYMKNSLFFVSSSRAETFCLVLAEALACGVAVISTNISGPVDFVFHNQNGLLVDYNDAVSMANAMDLLCFNEELLLKLKSNARASVEKFNLGSISKKYEELFCGQR